MQLVITTWNLEPGAALPQDTDTLLVDRSRASVFASKEEGLTFDRQS
ncbi:hypothetical protein IQ269_09650 [Tychonema sp. LEGE 07199]|nr:MULTISPECIES: hypothetical protein [unclassified Tychonema]MBE9121075.1 hypothetical protein [Tychonema sp. LEGE 07199]MBE9133498.1 hypothetical protein [Tychonema sp. LEGE 07196]